jgi:3-oxoacyl-[acyl-carrier protein] reductase
VRHKDKVVLVTGASRGIGRAIALRFADEGANLAINYRASREKAEAVKEEVVKRGVRAEIFPADVGKEEEAKKLIEAVLNTYGRLDVLVNNAGVNRDNLLLRMKEKEWDEVLETNLKGAFNCSRFALKYMLKQGFGCIINISSVVGIYGNPGQSNYAASKAGLIGFTKSLAKEVGRKRIRVVALAPGFIETEMTEKLPPDLKAKVLERIPLYRFGKPEEVASCVSFLASDEASYITGCVISVDGGLVL